MTTMFEVLICFHKTVHIDEQLHEGIHEPKGDFCFEVSKQVLLSR